MDLTEHVEGLVHEPTQAGERGLDLTVDAVYRVTGPGRVDFGGGELEAAEREPVATEQRDPDDDYGWWTLSGDVYLVAFNERLSAPADRAFVLQTRDAVRARGAFHPTLHLAGDDALEAVPLAVGDGGIAVKENARLSTLLPG
jgi:deoxycytidine triphosphate deaminase